MIRDFRRLLRIWAPAARLGRSARQLDVDTAFALAFDRPLTLDERRRLTELGSRRLGVGAGLLRSVIATFDKQRYPTPVAVRFGASQVETVDLGPFKLKIDTDDSSVTRQVLRDRTYEPHVRAFIEHTVRPGMTALDIGANIGFHTMLLASLVGSAGKVIAFEPNSENCRLILLSAAENNFHHVTLHPVALDGATGAAFLTAMTGSNGGLMPVGRETLLHPNCTVVAAARLDNLVDERVDFIKLDIEGAEYRALSGGVGVIEKRRPTLCLEFSMEMTARVSGISGPDFLRWLAGFGYQLFLLPRDGTPFREISDLDAFCADWGSPARIEDLAFVPKGAAF